MPSELILRFAQAEDYPFICALFREPHVGKQLTVEPWLMPVEGIIPFLTQGETRMFVAIRKEKRIGFATINDIDHRNRTAWLGMIAMVQSKECMRMGSIAKKIIAYGFNELNLNKMTFTTWSSNKVVLKWYEKAKIPLEGIERQHAFVDGEYLDLHRFGLLRSEFKEV